MPYARLDGPQVPTGKVTLAPQSAWASFYAFASTDGYGSQPGTDLGFLRAMSQTQLAWSIHSNIGQIPKKPLREPFKTRSQYLEIRHEGYLPAFLPLKQIKSGTFEVSLCPVLDKRIAVLDFPSTVANKKAPDFSQSIMHGIIQALEEQPELASYGYFSDTETDEFGRPLIEVGNQIITLAGVKEVEGQLESFNLPAISGEGRHLKRRDLEIQYVVCGSYELQ